MRNSPIIYLMLVGLLPALSGIDVKAIQERQDEMNRMLSAMSSTLKNILDELKDINRKTPK